MKTPSKETIKRTQRANLRNLYCPYTLDKNERKNRFRSLYGIFRQNLKTGLIEGFVEHSFSMGWSTDRVCLLSKSGAFEVAGGNDRKFQFSETKGYKHFIYRLTKRGKNATIIADFEERKRDCLSAETYMSKFNYRNIKFNTKGNVVPV